MEILDYLFTLEPEQIKKAVNALSLEEKKVLAQAVCRRVNDTEDQLLSIVTKMRKHRVEHVGFAAEH